MLITRIGSLYNAVIGFVVGGLGDFVYRLVLFGVLLGFLSLRVPYMYGLSGFALFIFISIFPLFCALFLSRLSESGFAKVFCEFIPEGTPIEIAPFVCLAETLSYLVRPVVLMIRPLLNLSVGSVCGVTLGGLSLLNDWVVLLLSLLFFYEIFVALVHWFIVCSILSFSESH